MAKPKRREFLQLAKTYDPKKHKVGGWYISEKCDGSRCFWDGGVSRGTPTRNVPYASIRDPKTGELKKKVKPCATGLWSRYGNPIMAPAWFLDQLPKCPLDGELFAGRGNFQRCRSIVAGDDPDERFREIQFACYGTPNPFTVFGSGEIKNANFHSTFDEKTLEWYLNRVEQTIDFTYLGTGVFMDEYRMLQEMLAGCRVAYALEQTQLPNDFVQAEFEVHRVLSRVLDEGGEGIMLRDPESEWKPRRVVSLLKYKPHFDDEAVVKGFVAGRTGKQGNVVGKIGALIVEWMGVGFELGSGLTMAQRAFKHSSDVQWARENPGEELPHTTTEAEHFKIGDVVTFKYRELTDDGIPKEVRFWRKPA